MSQWLRGTQEALSIYWVNRRWKDGCVEGGYTVNIESRIWRRVCDSEGPIPPLYFAVLPLYFVSCDPFPSIALLKIRASHLLDWFYVFSWEESCIFKVCVLVFKSRLSPVYNLSRPSFFTFHHHIQNFTLLQGATWWLVLRGSRVQVIQAMRCQWRCWPIPGLPIWGPPGLRVLHWHGQRPTLSATILPHTPNLGIDDDSAVPVRTSQGTLWSQATQISVLKKNNGLLFVAASCPAGGFQGFCSIPSPGAGGAVTIWNTDSRKEGMRTLWGLTPAMTCLTRK